MDAREGLRRDYTNDRGTHAAATSIARHSGAIAKLIRRAAAHGSPYLRQLPTCFPWIQLQRPIYLDTIAICQDVATIDRMPPDSGLQRIKVFIGKPLGNRASGYRVHDCGRRRQRNGHQPLLLRRCEDHLNLDIFHRDAYRTG